MDAGAIVLIISIFVGSICLGTVAYIVVQRHRYTARIEDSISRQISAASLSTPMESAESLSSLSGVQLLDGASPTGMHPMPAFCDPPDGTLPPPNSPRNDAIDALKELTRTKVNRLPAPSSEEEDDMCTTRVREDVHPFDADDEAVSMTCGPRSNYDELLGNLVA